MPSPLRALILHTMVSPPLLGHQAVLGELLEHAVGLRVFFIDLIHRNDDRYVCGFRVVDGLDSLRHDAVVRRDDQNNDCR